MGKYNVGDKVRVRTDLTIDQEYGETEVCFDRGMSRFCGQEVTIAFVFGDGDYKIAEDRTYYWCDELFESNTTKTNGLFLSFKNPIMSLVSLYKNLRLSEPQKSFQKAGVTDANGQLTEEGLALFVNYMLDQNGEGFNKDVVQPILEAQKSEEKK